MPWQQRITDLLIDVLRVSVRVVLFANAFILAVGSVYFIAKLVFFSLRWLDAGLFSRPW